MLQIDTTSATSPPMWEVCGRWGHRCKGVRYAPTWGWQPATSAATPGAAAPTSDRRDRPHQLGRAPSGAQVPGWPGCSCGSDDPRNLAEAEPQARSGIFHLQRFGQLGIEVCNEMEEGLLNRVTFLPWSAVLSIRGTTPQERAQGGRRLTREQVAQLAQRDNI